MFLSAQVESVEENGRERRDVLLYHVLLVFVDREAKGIEIFSCSLEVKSAYAGL